MDLLCSAYATPSDEEDEGQSLTVPVTRRARTQGAPSPVAPYALSNSRRFLPAIRAPAPTETLHAEGRYISKRERALMAAKASSPSSPLRAGILQTSPPLSTSVTAPVVGSISESDIPSDVLSALRHPKDQIKVDEGLGKQHIVLSGHSKAVNAVQWSHNRGHLLASAGMDQIVCVWNVWSNSQKKARVFTYHNAAVKDVRWSPQEFSLLSCGYDCCSRLVDVEHGVQKQHFTEDQVIAVVKFHPSNPNIFLTGGSKGSLRLWDIRSADVVQEYIKPLGPILDVEFSADARYLISSSDVSRSNVSENSIIVWDVSRQIPLSNQVYTEAYTCPCIRYHPFDACFVAQSNGNYIAIFSARPPFKLDRYKRYEKHEVEGYPIRCNFSLDGKELATGAADGYVRFYDYRSSELVRKVKAFEEACVDVAYHPVVPNLVAACSWSGSVRVFR